MDKRTKKEYLVFSEDPDIEEEMEVEKTVRNSLPAIGMVCNEKIILASATESYRSELMKKDNLSSVFNVGERAGMVSAGRLADAQSLAEDMRDAAMEDIELYGQLEDVNMLVEEVAEDVRETRQEIPYRSYGVSMIVGGINGDGSTDLYRLGLDGVITSWSAVAIGSNSESIIEELEKEYQNVENLESGLSLSIRLLVENSIVEKEDLSVATVSKSGIKRLTEERINDYGQTQGDNYE